MRNLALKINWQKENALATAREIIVFLQANKVNFYLDEEGAKKLNQPDRYKPHTEWHEIVDIVLVLGGDGTILKVSREFAGKNISILGINLGEVGFLATVETSELQTGLKKILTEDYLVLSRMMLSASVLRQGKKLAEYEALNDIAISKGPFSRIIDLKTYINDDFFETHPGDGVIISSPTGSTGYSLSAGGPIVNPSLGVIIITPICPHLLHHRSVIVHENDIIKIQVFSRHTEVVLTVDGQLGFSLQNEDEIIVQKSPNKTRLVNFKENNFYKILHHKLKMK